jgi:formylglycine-generating enzyme required for sulfatase activity
MAGNERPLGCRFAARLAIFVAIAGLSSLACGGELGRAGLAELRSASVSHATRMVASYDSNPSTAASKNIVCEAFFSGSFPVLSKLAELRVSVDELKAQNKPELAQTLYDLWRRKVDEARVSGIDLGGLKFLIEEATADHEAQNKSKEGRERRTREVEESNFLKGLRLAFHAIAPGKFMMGEVGKQIETEITRPFQMAATQTTQAVWRQVTLRAKEKFPGKYDSLISDPSKFKGELHPVERVSWDDVQLWIQALNELATVGDPVVQEVMPGHKLGEIFRLPTEAEWEFVVRIRGTAQDTYHFGQNTTDLVEYAWFDQNAGGRTHPVAQKKPLVLDGQEFYDMHGNVWEWTQDSWDGGSPLEGGKDPLGTTGFQRVARGGGGQFGAFDLRSAYRNFGLPGDSGQGNVGFRLVKALP